MSKRKKKLRGGAVIKAARASLFVSAGEVSGDHYVASLARRLREMGFGGAIRGLCGAEARGAGVECLWGAERLQVIGISEVIGSLRDILRVKAEMEREILASRPEVLLLVDSPDFNLPLVRSLRRSGYAGRVLYISPPSVWAWRSYRTKALRRDIDENLPLFKFEHDYLAGAGCHSLWIGHPFVEEFARFRPDRAEILSRVEGGAIGGRRAVALLPGSRRSEIEMLYPVLSGVYERLEADGYAPVFSVAPGLRERAADDLIARLTDAGQRYFRGEGRELMAASDAVAGASGTATAQALLLRRYMAVLYKVKPFSALIGRIFLRHLFFAVPNLLAGRMFFPEFIQERALSVPVAEALLARLGATEEEAARDDAEMERLAGLMGGVGVMRFWAGRVIAALEGRHAA